MSDIYGLQKKLAAIHGVSGDESPVADAIAALAKPYADEVYTDALGSLIVRKNGAGKRIMLSAHMDTIGLVATHIDDKGFIRFGTIGGIRPANIAHLNVTFKNGALGKVCPDGKYDPAKPAIDRMFIDIGCPDGESARKLVQPGDTVAFSAGCYLTSGMLVSPYLDDRIGCVILLEALKSIHTATNDLYFVFSAQEEVGCRGAKTAAYALEPDYGIAVDVTGTGDTPDTALKMECSLGKGAAVKIMDSSLICHPEVVALLEKAAADNSIPFQREVLERGGTDASSIQLSRGGVRSGGVSIPTRYIHSASEAAGIEDIENCVKLITAFCSLDLK